MVKLSTTVSHLRIINHKSCRSVPSLQYWPIVFILVLYTIRIRKYSSSPLYLLRFSLSPSQDLISSRSATHLWSQPTSDLRRTTENLILRHSWAFQPISQWPHHRRGQGRIMITSSSFSSSATAVSLLVFDFWSFLYFWVLVLWLKCLFWKIRPLLVRIWDGWCFSLKWILTFGLLISKLRCWKFFSFYKYFPE